MRSRSLFRARILPSIALLVTVATACGDDGGVQPDTVVRLAFLQNASDVPNIDLPSSARVGVPFTVVVRAATGGCGAQDALGVVLMGLRAELRPFIREPHPSRNVGCPGVVRRFEYTAQLTFARSGTATVVVFSGAIPIDGPATVTTRSLTVLP